MSLKVVESVPRRPDLQRPAVAGEWHRRPSLQTFSRVMGWIGAVQCGPDELRLVRGNSITTAKLDLRGGAADFPTVRVRTVIDLDEEVAAALPQTLNQRTELCSFRFGDGEGRLVAESLAAFCDENQSSQLLATVLAYAAGHHASLFKRVAVPLAPQPTHNALMRDMSAHAMLLGASRYLAEAGLAVKWKGTGFSCSFDRPDPVIVPLVPRCHVEMRPMLEPWMDEPGIGAFLYIRTLDKLVDNAEFAARLNARELHGGRTFPHLGAWHAHRHGICYRCTVPREIAFQGLGGTLAFWMVERTYFAMQQVDRLPLLPDCGNEREP